MKKYNSALDLDDSCVDAWVARGALYANQKNYSHSLSDFKRALELDPNHSNARVYYEKTREINDKIQSELESAQRGEFLLSDYDVSNSKLHSVSNKNQNQSSSNVKFKSKTSSSSSKLMDLNALISDESERESHHYKRKHKSSKKKHSSEKKGKWVGDSEDWIERK